MHHLFCYISHASSQGPAD